MCGNFRPSLGVVSASSIGCEEASAARDEDAPLLTLRGRSASFGVELARRYRPRLELPNAGSEVLPAEF